MDRITYQQCPVCGSPDLRPHVRSRDYLVSHQNFQIDVCAQCELGITQDVPEPAHIGAFYKSEDYISHTDTRKGIVNSLYHRVRNRMLVSKRHLIERFAEVSQGKLLDIGCGTGYFLGHMKQAGWEVNGTEPDADARRLASDHLGLEIFDSPGLFELPGESFEVVTMWHVLEHVYELKDYIRQIHSLLKDRGLLIIAVPNYLSTDAQIYNDSWAAYDVPRHLWHFAPQSLRQLVESSGLRMITRRRMPFDPFYISMISEKYRNNHFALLRGVVNGGISFVSSLANIEKSSSIIYVFQK